MYVDEICVQLAENRPQKQVQERLREYIIKNEEEADMIKEAIIKTGKKAGSDLRGSRGSHE